MAPSFPWSDCPQLRMVRSSPGLPDERALAEGFQLAIAEPTDALDIAQLLTAAFVEPWDVQRVEIELLNDPEVPTTFVIVHDSRIVATASYQTRPSEFPNCGWLHWVGAEPGLGGKGLGYVVSRAVLQEALRQGNDRTRLLTNDHRLPAIATYLKLGFEPDPYHESHAARWSEVKDLLQRGPITEPRPV